MPVLRIVPERRAGSGRWHLRLRHRQSAAPKLEQAGTAPFATAKPDVDEHGIERKTIYEGSPSWKAYVGYYLIAGFGAVLLIAILNMVSASDAASTTQFLNVIIPLAAGDRVRLRRQLLSQVDQVPRHEHGDRVRARPAVEADRRAAALADPRRRLQAEPRRSHPRHRPRRGRRAGPTNPDLEIVGMPASRQLFEQLRDSIEIQRQAKNVYGVVS